MTLSEPPTIARLPLHSFQRRFSRHDQDLQSEYSRPRSSSVIPIAAPAWHCFAEGVRRAAGGRRFVWHSCEPCRRQSYQSRPFRGRSRRPVDPDHSRADCQRMSLGWFLHTGPPGSKDRSHGCVAIRMISEIRMVDEQIGWASNPKSMNSCKSPNIKSNGLKLGTRAGLLSINTIARDNLRHSLAVAGVFQSDRRFEAPLGIDHENRPDAIWHRVGCFRHPGPGLGRVREGHG